MLKKIEALNKKVEMISQEKTKADAQREVWEGRLSESIANYAKEYGVNLSGKNFNEIKGKLSAEISKVEAETLAEYQRAEKLVGLIQSGDIKGAWKELGVDIDNKEVSGVEDNTQEELQGVAEAIEEVEDLSDDDFFGVSIEDDDDDGDFFIEEDEEVEIKEEPVKEEKPAPKPLFGGISFEDDDEEDEFLTPKSQTIEIEDDDEDDNPFSSSGFGGFGKILDGSKFKI